MIRMQTVLTSWQSAREDTAQAVSDFPEASMDEVLVEGVMTFRETALHILEVGSSFTGAMLNGVSHFNIPNLKESLAEYAMPLPDQASGKDLAEALLESMRDRYAAFCEQPGNFWSKEITSFDGKPVTCLEMVQRLKEHELTHRSQLFMLLRLKGIVPPTTRRREAARRQLA